MRSAIETKLTDHFGDLTDVALLQPVDVFLDTAGEGLRTRLFVTQDNTGVSLCLRPEYTIPVCLAHLASGAQTPVSYAYCGDVFRQSRPEGSQYVQAGAELIGGTGKAQDDLVMLDAALSLMPENVMENCLLRLGDQALFEALIRSLGVPLPLQTRLSKAFGHPGQVKHLLSRAAKGTKANLDADLAQCVANDDLPAASSLIRKTMKLASLPSAGGRTADEIAERLFEQAVLFSRPLDERVSGIVEAYLELSCPADKAIATLHEFATTHGVDFGEELDWFAAIVDGSSSYGNCQFEAGFGRPMDYYSGFVFELQLEGGNATKSIAVGGRYDRLFSVLGSTQPISAVGFSIAVDRLQNAGTM